MRSLAVEIVGIEGVGCSNGLLLLLLLRWQQGEAGLGSDGGLGVQAGDAGVVC